MVYIQKTNIWLFFFFSFFFLESRKYGQTRFDWICSFLHKSINQSNNRQCSRLQGTQEQTRTYVEKHPWPMMTNSAHQAPFVSVVTHSYEHADLHGNRSSWRNNVNWENGKELMTCSSTTSCLRGALVRNACVSAWETTIGKTWETLQHVCYTVCNEKNCCGVHEKFEVIQISLEGGEKKTTTTKNAIMGNTFLIEGKSKNKDIERKLEEWWNRWCWSCWH